MQKWMSFSFVALVLMSLSLSCITTEKPADPSPERTPQQVIDEETAEQEELESSFQSALNASGPDSLLEQQLEVHTLSQSLVEGFDLELEKVYQEKIRNPKVSVDLAALEKNRIELQAAWQFSEKTSHKIQNVYSRLLRESQDSKSPIKAAAQSSLVRIDQFFKNGWQEKNQVAVSALAHELESVNLDLKTQNPKAKTLNFKNYLKLSAASFQNKIQNFQLNKNLETQFKDFRNKRWNEYQIERKIEMKNRQPQADSIFPDPGSPGNINGSHFPPGVWSLTFDDGPHPTFSKGMIDALRAGNYTGTFFWLSKNMRAYKNTVEVAPTVGFRRGSHSFSHANLPKLSEAGLTHEIDEAADVFTNIVGDRPTFFRCPYGACGSNGSRIRQHIANRKMIHVAWNVDSLDWQDKNPQSIFNRVRKQMEVAGRGVVLFHDIHPQSVEAVKLVVAYLQSKSNWKVQTLDQIVEQQTGKEYPSP